MPVTILSRCQRFDFRRIKPEEMVERLKEVAGGAANEVNEDALWLIAKAAEGGLRDALSILDQGAAFAADTVTAEDIHSILGTVQQDILQSMAKFLADGKTGEALQVVSKLADLGKDLRLFTREMTTFLRGLLVDSIEGRGTVEQISNDNLFYLLKLLVQAEQDMKWSSQPSLVLELALVKASRPELGGSLEALTKRVAELERQLASGSLPKSRTPQITVPSESKPSHLGRTDHAEEKTQVPPVGKIVKEESPLPQEKTSLHAGGEDMSGVVRQGWPDLMGDIKGGKKPLWILLNETKPALEAQGNTVTLLFEDDFDVRRADKPEYKKYLEWLLGKHFSGSWEVRCVHAKKPLPSAPKPEEDPVYTEAVRIFGKDLVVLENDPS